MTPDPNIFFGPQRPQSLNSVPPDPHMAVGPSNVVVTVNDAIAWYDKNGKEQQLQSLEAFFGLGVSSGLFDSRVVYDALGGHFYVISPYRNQNAADPTKGESRIYVAESNTSDPTQGWHSFVFNSLLTSTSGATTTNYWVDYPTLAVDAYGVYITANYAPFSAADTEPGDDLEDEPPTDVAGGSSTRLFMLDKNISAQQIYDPEKMFGINLYTPHAATVYGSQAGLTGSFLVAYEQNNNANSTLHVFKVNNAAMGSSGGASFSMTTINVGNISNTDPAAVFAKQPNPIGLDAGNNWIYSAVWRAGILYATTEIVPVNTPDRAVVHWFRVNTTNMTLKDQGDVTADSLGPGISTSYGSIAVNANGQFAIGFSASSSGLYAGAYDAVYGPDGTLQTIQTLQAGQSAFVIDNNSGPNRLNRWGDYSGAAVDPSDDRSFWFFNQYALAPAGGQVDVSGQGNFEHEDARPDFVWNDNNSNMWRWQYDPILQVANTTSLGPTPGWTVVGSAHWSNNVVGGNDQMLMNYVPDGTMTLWWIANGALTGIDLGQRWNNINYITNGKFTPNGATNFLVNNTVDGHLYDWWIDNTLQGIDLTATSNISWSSMALVGSGQFTTNGGSNINDLLVFNRTNNDLYNWWIDANNTLQGINLSAATGVKWINLEMVDTGKFTPSGGTNLLVHNTLDNHLYDWWIDSSNTLSGIDLGAYWSNVQIFAVGQFDNKTTNTEILVQNTVDHHLYEWWITAQGQLTGIDLGSIASVELVGTGRYNNNSAFDQMLVHNTFDGHLYQWWINGNQLSGVDLASNLWATVAGSTTPPPVASTSLPSSDSTALLIQSMASFGAGSAAVNSTSPLAAVDLSQQSALAAPINPQLPHV